MATHKKKAATKRLRKIVVQELLNFSESSEDDEQHPSDVRVKPAVKKDVEKCDSSKENGSKEPVVGGSLQRTDCRDELQPSHLPLKRLHPAAKEGLDTCSVQDDSKDNGFKEPILRDLHRNVLKETNVKERMDLKLEKGGSLQKKVSKKPILAERADVKKERGKNIDDIILQRKTTDSDGKSNMEECSAARGKKTEIMQRSDKMKKKTASAKPKTTSRQLLQNMTLADLGISFDSSPDVDSKTKTSLKECSPVPVKNFETGQVADSDSMKKTAAAKPKPKIKTKTSLKECSAAPLKITETKQVADRLKMKKSACTKSKAKSRQHLQNMTLADMGISFDFSSESSDDGKEGKAAENEGMKKKGKKQQHDDGGITQQPGRLDKPDRECERNGKHEAQSVMDSRAVTELDADSVDVRPPCSIDDQISTDLCRKLATDCKIQSAVKVKAAVPTDKQKDRSVLPANLTGHAEKEPASGTDSKTDLHGKGPLQIDHHSETERLTMTDRKTQRKAEGHNERPALPQPYVSLIRSSHSGCSLVASPSEETLLPLWESTRLDIDCPPSASSPRHVSSDPHCPGSSRDPEEAPHSSAAPKHSMGHRDSPTVIQQSPLLFDSSLGLGESQNSSYEQLGIVKKNAAQTAKPAQAVSISVTSKTETRNDNKLSRVDRYLLDYGTQMSQKGSMMMDESLVVSDHEKGDKLSRTGEGSLSECSSKKGDRLAAGRDGSSLSVSGPDETSEVETTQYATCLTTPDESSVYETVDVSIQTSLGSQHVSDLSPDASHHVSDLSPDASHHVSDLSPDASHHVSDLSPDASHHVSDLSPDASHHVSDLSPDASHHVSDLSPDASHHVSDLSPDASQDVSDLSPDASHHVSDLSPDASSVYEAVDVSVQTSFQPCPDSTTPITGHVQPQAPPERNAYQAWCAHSDAVSSNPTDSNYFSDSVGGEENTVAGDGQSSLHDAHNDHHPHTLASLPGVLHSEKQGKEVEEREKEEREEKEQEEREEEKKEEREKKKEEEEKEERERKEEEEERKEEEEKEEEEEKKEEEEEETEEEEESDHAANTERGPSSFGSQPSCSTGARHQQSTGWRSPRNQMDSSSDDDSDDNLEAFLQKLRTPAQPANRVAVEDEDMGNFIVDDSDVTESEEDLSDAVADDDDDDLCSDVLPESLPRTRSARCQGKASPTPQRQTITAEDVVSEDSDDDDVDDDELPDLTPPITKGKSLVADEDDVLLPEITPPKTKRRPTWSLSQTPCEASPKWYTPATSFKTKKEGKGDVWATPSCLLTTTTKNSNTLNFLRSLTADTPDHLRHTEARRYMLQFKQRQQELSSRLFQLFNNTVFDNQLPADMAVVWNKRLLTTAGRCKQKRVNTTYTAYIELSTKVCDSAERVRDTLIHEMCHAAVWIVNKAKEAHGPYWRYWAYKANKVHPELPVIGRCHDYNISTKYIYKCVKCGYQIGRHSKSLDTDRKVCGICHGHFQLLRAHGGADTPLSTPCAPRAPTPFARFVKQHYGRLRQGGILSHKQVMEALSKDFARTKINF